MCMYFKFTKAYFILATCTCTCTVRVNFYIAYTVDWQVIKIAQLNIDYNVNCICMIIHAFIL